MVDRSRSAYYNDPNLPGLKPAYAKLAIRLDTDQFVWCYVCEDKHIISPSETKTEWEIEVPDSAVLVIVNSYVWNMILGIRCCAPPSIREEAWRRAVAGNIPAERAAIQQELEDEFFAPHPPQVLWGQLFMRDTSAEGATPLVRYPLKDEWVIARRTATEVLEARRPKGREYPRPSATS